MPAERVAMRVVREVLRLTFAGGFQARGPALSRDAVADRSAYCSAQRAFKPDRPLFAVSG